MRRAGGAVAAGLAIAALSGCGLAAPGGAGVSVTITRDFGARLLERGAERRVATSETVLELLRRRFAATTGPSGRPLQSIDGLSGGSSRVDWMLFVNGVLSYGMGQLHGGDTVWGDLHDFSATQVIRAVVGAYPQPFTNGIGGKRYPTTLECASDVGTACKLAGAALGRAGVPYASQYIGTGSGSDTLGVVVGTWKDLRGELATALLQHGPGASGVYARFGPDGSTLQLLDGAGNVVRTLSGSVGLVAATADSQSPAPTWLIIGTNPAGAVAAARALNARMLHDHYAVAVAGGAAIPVPVP